MPCYEGHDRSNTYVNYMSSWVLQGDIHHITRINYQCGTKTPVLTTNSFFL
jgi:hypothetical protein